ncbi:MAG: RpiB/LacA/LacB family sugar-phosphate isomerase [Clostridia bacterium]|nr:RpiB/LacA/LacB family sugar-phosphate isomerase [Clostridia bacterium]
MFEKFVIAYDHRVDLKYIERIKNYLQEKGLGYVVVDDNGETNDYPVLASIAYELYLKTKASGMILLCGTGVGMNVVANKFAGIRSVLPSEEGSAYFARNDEDANCIVFAAGKANDKYEVKICKRKMIRILDVFISTPFEGGRHARRVEQIGKIERGEKI